MSNHALEDWLMREVGEVAPPGNPGAGAPNIGGPAPAQLGGPPQEMNLNPPPDQGQGQEDDAFPDLGNDPMAPDMPEEKSQEMDFQQWKKLYFKEIVKGDTSRLIDLVRQVRDLDLEPYPRKFVEDNLQILFLRQQANIDKACKEIRSSMREELDQNNPAVSTVNHMYNTLQTMPELSNVFIKLKGTLGMKADLHRKFIASLLGAVQVGSGSNNEDLVFEEKEYSIRFSTRYNDRWGRVDLGRWALKVDDPERYLSEPEQKRLEEGSPEEKSVLRRRVVMESIAETFKRRAFIINVVGTDGTVFTLGWDLGGSLRAAYTEGKLIVKTFQSEASEAMIDDEGHIIPFVDLKIKYVTQTGEVGADGKPEEEEHDFMEKIDGMLFLTSQLHILREAASSFQGIVFKEQSYNGNPSDLRTLYRCQPSSAEILMRNC